MGPLPEPYCQTTTIQPPDPPYVTFVTDDPTSPEEVLPEESDSSNLILYSDSMATVYPRSSPSSSNTTIHQTPPFQVTNQEPPPVRTSHTFNLQHLNIQHHPTEYLNQLYKWSSPHHQIIAKARISPHLYPLHLNPIYLSNNTHCHC